MSRFCVKNFHRSLAQFCADTYQDGHAYTHFAPLNDVEAATYPWRDCLVLAFRGTETQFSGWSDTLDVLRDLRMWPWWTPNGWVHTGFYKGALNWCKEYDGWMLQRFPLCNKLILTGHSLGAALAVQYALLTKHPVQEVVLFGEPRGLFPSSVESYKRKGLDKVTTSYKEGGDLVTAVPPWGCHSVELTHIGAESGYDHSITQYIDALEG